MHVKKERILEKLKEIEDLTDELLIKDPNDNDLIRLKNGFPGIKSKIEKSWPLVEDDRKQINIGMYAVRVLEGGPYDNLPTLLMKLDTYLSHTEAELRDQGIDPSQY